MNAQCIILMTLSNRTLETHTILSTSHPNKFNKQKIGYTAHYSSIFFFKYLSHLFLEWILLWSSPSVPQKFSSWNQVTVHLVYSKCHIPSLIYKHFNTHLWKAWLIYTKLLKYSFKILTLIFCYACENICL